MSVPQESEAVSPFPVFNVCDYGAVADGSTNATAQIQKAIDACTGTGGGLVYIPAGDFLTGTITLKDNVTLYLGPGATLWGSKCIDDYEPKHLIFAENAAGITVKGEGGINGQGDSFWNAHLQANPSGRPKWDKPKPRPFSLLNFRNCRNVRISDITIENAPAWTIHPVMCDDVIIHNVTIRNFSSGPNTDGIDLDACRNVMVSDCNIFTGDDAIVLKNTGYLGEVRLSKNICVTNCVISSICNGFKIGTETREGFQDVTFSNSVIYNASKGGGANCAIAVEMVDGAKLDGVLVSNISIMNAQTAIFIRLGNRGRGQDVPTPGVLRNVMMAGILARNVVTTASVTGLPGHDVENVTLSNIRLEVEGGGSQADADAEAPELPDSYPRATMFGVLPAYGLYCRHVRGLRLCNFEVEPAMPDERPCVVLDDVKNAMITACRVSDGARAFLAVKGGETEKISVTASDLSGAATPFAVSEEVPEKALYVSANRLD